MLTDNSGRPLVPTAKINVHNLQQNGNGGYTVDFSLVPDPNLNRLVWIKGQGLGTEITVRVRAQLQFEYCGGETPPCIACITFEEVLDDNPERRDKTYGERRNFPDPLGLKAFPKRTITPGNGITLLNVQDDCPVEACFKFNLTIQLPSGKSIIIDPKIRNLPM